MRCNMREAKIQLSKLVQAALEGEDVVIADKGVPLVRLVRVSTQNFVRKPGAWAGLPKASDDWDMAETNEAIADELVGGELP